MKNYKQLLFLPVIILSAISCYAQTPTQVKPQTNMPVSDQPTLGEVTKMVIALQQSNKQLQDKLNALQAQVNINYKAQDFVIGQLQKKTDALSSSQDAAANKINAEISAIQSAQTHGSTVNSFIVTAGQSNLADAFSPPVNTLSGKYYRSVIIDNPSCNNNPNAVIIAVSQSSGFGYNLPAAVALNYDKSINKWKIVINPNGTNSTVTGLAKPTTGSSMVSVLDYYPYQINNGDKFNVEVIKQ